MHVFNDVLTWYSSCHLVTVPPGPALADALRTSPVVQGEDGYTPAAGGFGTGFDDLDPNLDPELALVGIPLIHTLIPQGIRFITMWHAIS